MARGHRKCFLCPLAIFQCPLAPFSAVSCLQEGCDNQTVENSTTCNKWALNLYIYHNSYICYFSKNYLSKMSYYLVLLHISSSPHFFSGIFSVSSVQFDLHISDAIVFRPRPFNLIEFRLLRIFSASPVQFDRILSSFFQPIHQKRLLRVLRFSARDHPLNDNTLYHKYIMIFSSENVWRFSLT